MRRDEKIEIQDVRELRMEHMCLVNRSRETFRLLTEYLNFYQGAKTSVTVKRLRIAERFRSDLGRHV